MSNSFPITPQTANQYFQAGNQALAQKKIDSAIAHIQKAIELHPNLALYYQTLGDVLVQIEKWEEAATTYQKAIELKPTSALSHHNLGKVLEKQGRLDEAIASFSQAIKINPNFSEFYISLGAALVQKGLLYEAIAHFQKAISLEPDSSMAHQNLGVALEKQGQIEEGIICYRKAIEIDPGFWEGYQKLGTALTKLGDFHQAAEIYGKACQIIPNFATVYHYCGEALAKLHRWDEAIAAYQKAIGLLGEDKSTAPTAVVYHQFGYALTQQQKWEEAISAYRKATELQPNSPEVYHHLGYALAQQQKWEEATAAYRKVTELQPDSPEVYHYLGYALSKLQQWEEAVVAYRRASELQPNSPDVYHQLGHALIQLKQNDWAVAVLRQAIELNPNLAEAYGDLGKALSNIKQWNEAIASFQKAIKLNPNLAEVYGYLGEVYAAQKQWDKAIINYRRALELNPKWPEVHYSLALALAQQQKFDDAIVSYRQAIELGVNTAEIHHKLGHTLSKLKRWEEAVVSYGRAVEINPNSAAVYHVLGESLVQLERWDEAVVAYTKARQLNPKSADVAYHIGELMSKLGRWDEAVTAYAKAVELRPLSAKFHFQLGEAKTKKNPLSEAISCYRRALEIDPHFSKAKKKLEEVLSFQNVLRTGELGSLSLLGETEFEGCLDYATIDYVSGWARNKKDPDKVVFLDIFVGNNLVGTLVANKYRQDLAEAFGTHGCHAFAQKIPPSLHSNGLVEVSVKITETGQQLKNSPQPLVVGPKGKKHEVNLSFEQGEINKLIYRVQGVRSQESGVRSKEFKSQNLKFQSEAGVNSQFKSQNSKFKSAEKPKVAVIILSLNGAKLLSELFASFELYNSYEKLELIVVDHGSTDNTIDVCTQWSEKLPIKIIARGENYSFSNSNNVGVDETKAPLLLFMNNDITLCQDIIPQMVELIQQDENLGMVGVKLLDIVSDRSLAFPPTQHLGVQLYFHSQNEPFYPFEIRYAPQLLKIQSAPWKVPVVTGALMMCRREDFQKVGGFNEDYFYGYEDVDLCLTIRQKLGKEIISANHLTAFHNRGFSRFNKGKEFTQKILKNRPIIEKRYAYYLRRKHLQDYFDKGIYWTGHPLTIGFAVTEADMAASAGDYFTAVELGEQLVKEFGWDIYYISEGEDWYDMTRLDVIVVMRHDYDLERIENAKPSLVKVAWARNWFEIWASQKSAGDYDCFWCSSQKSADYIQQKLFKPATVVRIATNEERFKEFRSEEEGVRSQESGVRSEEEFRIQNSEFRSEEEGVRSQESGVRSEEKVRTELSNKVSETGKSKVGKNSEVEISQDSEKSFSELGNKIPEVGKNSEVAIFNQSEKINSEPEKNSELGISEESEKISSEVGNKFPQVGESQVEKISELAISEESEKISSEVEKNSEAANFNQSEKVNSKLDNKYKSDYCFTGSFWKYPRDIMNLLEPDNLPFEFALYGYNWEKFEKFKKYNRGPLPYTDMPKVYASTKIVIDDANSVTKQWGSTNSRVFDAIMSGALVVTNGELGNQESFDGLLPTYNSRESLENLLREYFTNEELRLAKVAELQKIVTEKHTYKHRAHTIFSALREKMSNSFRIGIKIGVPDWKQAQEWGEYHFALAMKRQFEILGHSVRIDILPEWENPQIFGDDVAITIRGLSRYQPKSYHINLMWNISHPDKVSLQEYEQYDRVFVASHSYAEELQKKVKVPVQTLLQCTDPNLFYPDKEGYEEIGEILFVGNSRKVYRQIVKDAVKSGLKVDVYGTNWGNLLPDGYLKGEYIPNEILRRYYSKCGVLLNDHWDTMREKGFISNRLFDAAACGATIVSDKIAGLEEVFGNKISTYNSQEDLPKVVEDSLQQKSQNRREKLDLAKYVRENHSFEKRVREMLEAIVTLHQKKMQSPN
ncbi:MULTISPECIES: tetratricopeptide repeat protein [unclassified Okeania]|uniref:tetratricopeptide repeat protein n=1 Tax=unclassified Okeania TaxID=2634635 RepID=UPI0013B86696|nr:MULTISPECIES: tetratricopeptide repeat protein [unclassified Okeania]NES76925.1 tetratricopeptide repeat protein [Okeania sp. SIO1H4]NET20554.1 tetratricopeptide repeat protein [Okeania sp. SIO1H5]NET93721.1 tetratricopeptide repeat protein [Okeania sp. SIO1H2]